MIFADADTTNVVINFWQSLATTVLGIVVTLIGFWATVVRHMATRQEVCDLIKNSSPYTRDRQYIMERLAINKEMQEELSNALKHNSEVMNDLKVQIAILANTLGALESRMEK
jgi:hypothetical protein